MQRIGRTRALNNMSEVDNETTNGVVTWVLIGLYFKIAMIVKALNNTPTIDMMSPIEPAKSAETSENTNSWDVFIACWRNLIVIIFNINIYDKWN